MCSFLDVLHFVFSTFWIFIGTVILLSILTTLVLGFVTTSFNIVVALLKGVSPTLTVFPKKSE